MSPTATAEPFRSAAVDAAGASAVATGLSLPGSASTRLSSALLLARAQALGRCARIASRHIADEDGRLAAAQALAERAWHRLCYGADRTVVAIAGPTGSGKSSLFNALAGMDVAGTGHLRPTTRTAHACLWSAGPESGTGPDGQDPLLDWLGVNRERRFIRESPLDGDGERALRGLVLVDLPDVDSIAAGHRTEADRLIGVVDLVVWVLDPQKYADRTVHDDYLRRFGPLRDVTAVVLNQIDRLSRRDAARCRADLARLVAADGLGGVAVLETSAVTGEGVPAVRARLEQAVAGRPAALLRLEAELAEAVRSLAPLVTGDGDPDVSTGDVSAVDVSVADVLARAPGPALEGDPAAVRAVLREFIAAVTADLPAAWRILAEQAMAAGMGALPAALGDAVPARDTDPRGLSRWLTRVGRRLAPARARRHQAEAQLRLRTAVAGVARQVAEPVLQVRRDHDAARHAWHRAAGVRL